MAANDKDSWVLMMMQKLRKLSLRNQRRAYAAFYFLAWREGTEPNPEPLIKHIGWIVRGAYEISINDLPEANTLARLAYVWLQLTKGK
jgi:hypothetical protein